MSVSMYSNQVDRINDDLANLRGKLADERKKLADANAKAMKATEGLAKAKTPSQLSSRSRESSAIKSGQPGTRRKPQIWKSR